MRLLFVCPDMRTGGAERQWATLIPALRERGAEAIGISISPPQVAHCQAQGLDARLLNYKELPMEWAGQFDGIIANGSPEHFVMPADVVAM